MRCRLVAIIALLFVICSPAFAQTRISVDVGWNGLIRIARGGNTPVICVAGRGDGPRQVAASLDNAGFDTGWLEVERLPTVAGGYDALDLLILASPDLSAITPEQQQAIAGWVTAGGR